MLADSLGHGIVAERGFAGLKAGHLAVAAAVRREGPLCLHPGAVCKEAAPASEGDLLSKELLLGLWHVGLGVKPRRVRAAGRAAANRSLREGADGAVRGELVFQTGNGELRLRRRS